MVTSPLNDLSILKLPQTWDKRIQQIIFDNRMLYEPWIESAKNFNELKSRLQSRGFSDVSSGVNPLLDLAAYSKAPIADTSECHVRKTMMRKKS